MLGKSLREKQDLAAGSKRRIGSLVPLNPVRKAAIQVGQVFERSGAVAVGHSDENSVELSLKSKRRADWAKLHELVAHGQRGQELRPLQGLGLIGQCDECSEHVLVPGWQR